MVDQTPGIRSGPGIRSTVGYIVLSIAVMGSMWVEFMNKCWNRKDYVMMSPLTFRYSFHPALSGFVFMLNKKEHVLPSCL